MKQFVKLLECPLYIFSVVSLDEVKHFPLVRIWLLHAEQVLIFANNSSNSHLIISKEGSTKEETTCNSINQATSSKKEPVEVVSSPELLEEYSLLHDSLLFSSVKAAGINKAQLQPGCLRIPMGTRSLILCNIGC